MIPSEVVPGRVGPAISGVEMKLAENEEIVVRGPNIFPGYWNRPEETARSCAMAGFTPAIRAKSMPTETGGLSGGIKNLIILGSGHNIAPEPIEEDILHDLPERSRWCWWATGGDIWRRL